MTHLTIYEWGRADVGGGPLCFSRSQADALLTAARAHRLGGEEGTQILVDHHRYLRARQVVGVLAARDCSLEILPKIDREAGDEEASRVRARLVHMLDVALGLELSPGAESQLARQSETLLDILIRHFADRLIGEIRHGLPRQYQGYAEDLPTLRGRLDVRRQFSAHAVRPDRLSCQFDSLSPDTPLLQVMKACVLFVDKFARASETRRRLNELRLVMSDVSDVHPTRLPWDKIRIDRSSRRWKALHQLATLFLRREWLATHHDARRDAGMTLLFSMNELYEAYVAALIRRPLAIAGYEVVVQGGLRYCLGEWRSGADCHGNLFQTRPDIAIRKDGSVVAIIDTKWKAISGAIEDRKRGISQADVYQMMAYSQIYECDRLMLLYPHSAPLGDGRLVASYGVAVTNGARLDVATVDLKGGRAAVERELTALVLGMLGPGAVRAAVDAN